MTDDLMRQAYRVLTDSEKEQMLELKALGEKFCAQLDTFPPSREYSLAKTKMEEAVMWAVKGLTR